MTRHVFISHSHKDDESALGILAELERRGVKCWTAPRDVTPGGSYAESIIDGIANSSCFVLVYTENSNVSPHVLREVERALAMGINIIPIRFDNSNVSKSLDYLLATVHWLSVVAEPRASAIGDAAQRIQSCIEGSTPTVRVPPPPAVPHQTPADPAAVPSPSNVTRSILLLALVGLLVSGAVWTAYFFLQRPRDDTRTLANLSSPPNTISAPATASVSATPAIVLPSPSPEESTTESQNASSTETPETSLPAEATAPPARAPISSPLAVVRRYYDLLSQRDTIKAYEMLSTSYRLRESFASYTRSFASTTSMRLLNSHLISNGGANASVYVDFEKMNQRFGRIEWRGPVTLVFEADGWRIDNLQGLRAAPNHR